MPAVATAPPAAPPSERRIAPRLQPAFGTICKLRPADGTPAIGLVCNLSETGVSMFVADPPAKGEEMEAELAPEDGGPGLAITLRVVHVRRTPTGDFCLGAQFTRPLGVEEIQQFLTPPSSAKLAAS